jgi:hypothetical protein
MELSKLMEADEVRLTPLSYIAEREPGELIEAEMVSVEQLVEFLGIIQKTINLARELRLLPLKLLLADKLTDLNEAAKMVATRFAALKDFTRPENLNEWHRQKESFLSALRNNCQSFCDVGISVYPYLALKSSGVQLQTGEADRLLRKFKEEIDFELEIIKGKSSEFDSILQAARDTAAHAAVSHHASVFGGIADEHTSAGKSWLIAAIVSVLVTFVAALGFLYLLPPLGDLKEAATIQRIITKLVIISTLYYIALWSAKNYRTHQHLSVVNKHRQSALKSFDAFIKAASGDEQTKNAVLLEATRCIFAPVNTGYLGADEENSSDRIIEIIKTVGGSAGK